MCRTSNIILIRLHVYISKCGHTENYLYSALLCDVINIMCSNRYNIDTFTCTTCVFFVSQVIITWRRNANNRRQGEIRYNWYSYNGSVFRQRVIFIMKTARVDITSLWKTKHGAIFQMFCPLMSLTVIILPGGSYYMYIYTNVSIIYLYWYYRRDQTAAINTII